MLEAIEKGAALARPQGCQYSTAAEIWPRDHRYSAITIEPIHGAFELVNIL